MFYILKKEKYILLLFQNIIQIVKNKLSFLIITNGEGRNYLAIKKLSALNNV